ncbi:E3 ubiquitin-protein ligase MARCH7-like isoform X3 [Vombatus ursinus]|uniref:E3 ubiquitin-protein ligase MARCH7 isoform X3 n=1 Tax=Vombatus ursinus TaxID=29139 RepID=UPI000FFD533D|nr:E3 ubiquitin-protein ligase MARCH7 isoform X3 [Vombatus ursinus]XP_027721891.1 E3 ubiquitin-protein ligase MARCH7-like isoform X3 [Vombatus ursinus]
MESKPSRIPRRITVEPSSSSLSARTVSGGRGNGMSDAYHPRESPFRLNSEHQATSSSLTSPFQSSWYGESERTQGAYPRLQNQQREHDSKRPKLSYTSCTTTSAGRNNGSGLNSISDSSWRHSQIPRSSSMVLGSLGTELVRERRDLERRTDPSISLMDCSHRSGDFTSSSYLQDRVASSYSQGARPKENSLNTLRLNTSSMNRQWPSEHQSSFYSREPSRNSSRSNFSRREMESPQRSVQQGFSYIPNRDEAPSVSNSERIGSSQRSLAEPSNDTEGRRTTRQLLSRLASSMSSTFFSRRSSQDSLNTRSLDSENSYLAPRVLTSTQSSGSAASSSEVPDNRTPESSQGFRFLRRRWGLSSVGQNPNSETGSENFSQESESRNAGSWLSSSLRNRCTPLFSRRRREGRDESTRIHTTDVPSRPQHVLRRESNEEVHLETQNESLGTTANRSQTPTVPSSAAASAASTPDLAHSGRSTGISGILPGSLFRFAVPSALGSSLSDNVMITVDIIPSGWNSSDGQNDRTKTLPSRDPERLQKIKESLLLEDSDEEEGDLCRICQMAAASSSNLLIEPCKCTGSLQYVHQECMKKWLQAKINSGSSLEAVTTCELCKEKLQLNLEDFDIHELHRAHANEQVSIFCLIWRSMSLSALVCTWLCYCIYVNKAFLICWELQVKLARVSDLLTLQELFRHIWKILKPLRMNLKKMETTTEHLTWPNIMWDK